jgi:hypothetical protein
MKEISFITGFVRTGPDLKTRNSPGNNQLPSYFRLLSGYDQDTDFYLSVPSFLCHAGGIFRLENKTGHKAGGCITCQVHLPRRFFQHDRVCCLPGCKQALAFFIYPNRSLIQGGEPAIRMTGPFSCRIFLN